MTYEQYARYILEDYKMSKIMEQLIPGEHFIYNNIEFVCLDVIDGNYLAVTAKPWSEIPFDTNNKNNWCNSSLRRVLANDFLPQLEQKHLIKQTSNLIADTGDKSYGVCEDYVTILSCDQYRKYREFVPLFEEWMWTLTPWSCDTSYASLVRIVGTDGTLHYYNAYVSYGVAPACIFSSANLKLRRQAQLVDISEGGE